MPGLGRRASRARVRGPFLVRRASPRRGRRL